VIIGPGPSLPEVRDIEIPTPAGRRGARVYRPEKDPKLPTIVHFHAGGWVLGEVDDYDAMLRKLARASRCTIMSVDYRKAPEHRFPAALEDAYEAVSWAFENLSPGAAVGVAGESAGGNLAVASALRAYQEGGPAIAFQVVAYPVLDHDFERASYREHGSAGLPLGRPEMQWFFDQYLPRTSDRDHPLASPLRAVDLSMMPPAIVVVAEHDPLRDDGLEYAERLHADGRLARLLYQPDLTHGFLSMVNLLVRADEVIEELGAAIQDLLGSGLVV
jgi:acetyl esterase